MKSPMLQTLLGGIVGIGSIGALALPGWAMADDEADVSSRALSGVRPKAKAGPDQVVDEQVKVILKGAGTDSDGTVVAYQWMQVTGPAVTIANAKRAKASFMAPDVAEPQVLTFKLVVTDNSGLKGNDTVAITVNPLVPPLTVGVLLNDTGITGCADVSSNALPCPVSGYPGQDAEFGRDVTHNDDSDGHAGFSFTKLDATGAPLPVEATEWSCVKDNVTGLIWEVKTDDGGLRDWDWTYTWYDPNPATNGGSAGYQDGGGCAESACNTDAFVKAVNAQGLCGATDWRMPNVEELRSIVDLSRGSPAIDVNFFPYTHVSSFWSASPVAASPGASPVAASPGASPVAGNSDYAWLVNFGNGNGYWNYRGFTYYVRLVRAGQ